MLLSMTGFGGREAKAAALGKISVELRSTNHKFLEIVLHVPDGFISLEDKIKKTIESKLRRGRVTCVINFSGGQSSNAAINQNLMKRYIHIFKDAQKKFHLADSVTINTLARLPGILSVEDNELDKAAVWARLEALLRSALGDLVSMRRKEGRALQGFLNTRALSLKADLEAIKARFRKAVKEKTAALSSNDERAAFLKNADIAEEVDRLGFHIKNFLQKIQKDGPIGKELDFIAQEMQREANTMGAKSFDAAVSGKVVQIKSQIEKIREQVQNVE